jgi:hypothetical protein
MTNDRDVIAHIAVDGIGHRGFSAASAASDGNDDGARHPPVQQQVLVRRYRWRQLRQLQQLRLLRQLR